MSEPLHLEDWEIALLADVDTSPRVIEVRTRCVGEGAIEQAAEAEANFERDKTLGLYDFEEFRDGAE